MPLEAWLQRSKPEALSLDADLIAALAPPPRRLGGAALLAAG